MDIKRKGIEKILVTGREGCVEYLTFPSFERTGLVTHLFSTRLGGVSEGMFSSMNFSYMRGDKKEAVDENYRRIAAVLGRCVEDMVCADQTHTTNIRKVTRADCGKGIVKEKDYKEIDGLITNEPGIVLSTFYADCVPLFILDKKNKAIGLSHAGWRGTVNEMGRHTLEQMKDAYQTEPADVIVGIGPSICNTCYEVGEDVANAFLERFPNPLHKALIVTEKENGKYHLDLWQANAIGFKQVGVLEENITVTDICTCCNSNYLFSHRASNGKRGNLGAFMCLNG